MTRVLGCCDVYATRRRPDARTGRRRVGLEIESIGEIERTVAGETFDDEDEGGHHGQSRVLNLDRLENAEILLGLAGGEAERIEESAVVKGGANGGCEQNCEQRRETRAVS